MSGLTIPLSSGAILLRQAVLFPHGALPLFIFEPRYREMLAEALEGNRLMCVGNLCGAEKARPADCVAPVGSIALIRAARQLKNGNYTILLHGILRVRFKQWLPDSRYPKAEIEPVLDISLSDGAEKSAKRSMHRALQNALAPFPDEIMARFADVLAQAGDAAAISDTLAQQLVHNPAKRQTLLDTPDIRKRVALLTDFLNKADDLM